MLDAHDTPLTFGMAGSLEVRVPFCDQRLVDYVYNVPWSLTAMDGEPKGLLKEAAADLVPTSVLRRRKSPYPTTADPRYEKDLRTRVRDLIAADSPALEVLDRNGLETMLERSEGSFDSQLDRNGLESAVSLDAWFDRYRLRLA